jgi:tRNA(Ile)-lysidine synthase
LVNTNNLELTDKNIVVALSGGLDSVVLLHWLVEYYPKNSIRAIHINHNISKYAGDWQDFCDSLCQKLKVPYQSFSIKVNTNNVEHNARIKRYEVFANNLNQDEYLCTAHHKNDQAETLLLQLFRGSGGLGLAAMPKIRALGKGFLYRPFLQLNQIEIKNYAQQYQLKWCDDESNKDKDFRRNFIRLVTLPSLGENYPNIINNLSRSARHQAENNQLLEILASNDIKDYALLKNKQLQVTPLLKLEKPRIKNILRFMIKRLNWTLPSEKVINEIIDSALVAKEDASPVVCWHTYELRRFHDRLYFINTTKVKTFEAISFKDFKQLEPFKQLLETDFTIGYRNNHKNKKSLKKHFQEKSIPPWEREEIPLYYVKCKLCAMGTSTRIVFLS